MGAQVGGGRGRGRRAFRDINVTPLVDVMLVLLIVFMVTAPLLTTGLRIDLPEVQAAESPIKDARLLVTVTREGQVLFGEKDVTGHVAEAFRESQRVQTEQQLYIRADKEARYGVVAEVVAAARNSGVASLNLLVQPEMEETDEGEPEGNAPAGTAPPRHVGPAVSEATSFDWAETSRRRGAFTSKEIQLAFLLALVVQVVFFGLLAFFGDSRGAVRKEQVTEVKEIPIAVQPVLDELPLLKLGSKKKVKPKLPQMWQKRAPVPVKRYEERSAPSDQAPDDPEKIPESKLADKEHEAPPEDAEIVKELEQELEDPEEDLERPEYDEEGAEDGSEFGTETDPLKARQIDLYRAKIASWFNARFTQPTDQIPCAELKKLAASVAVSVGGNRSITGFTVTSPSGNATFDQRVKSTMSALVGEQLPPPPPLYPDILGTTLSPRLSGQWAPCQVSSSPAPSSPAPGDDAGTDPPPSGDGSAESE